MDACAEVLYVVFDLSNKKHIQVLILNNAKMHTVQCHRVEQVAWRDILLYGIRVVVFFAVQSLPQGLPQPRSLPIDVGVIGQKHWRSESGAGFLSLDRCVL